MYLHVLLPENVGVKHCNFESLKPLISTRKKFLTKNHPAIPVIPPLLKRSGSSMMPVTVFSTPGGSEVSRITSLLHPEALNPLVFTKQPSFVCWNR